MSITSNSFPIDRIRLDLDDSRPRDLEHLTRSFEAGADVRGLRRISFALTQPQILDGTKDVTRRLGWRSLKPGALLLGVDKAMGLSAGQKSKQLAIIEIVSVRRERLDSITDDDVRREGFNFGDAHWFASMFVDAMRCEIGSEVTRIEFRFVARRRLSTCIGQNKSCVAALKKKGRLVGDANRARTLRVLPAEGGGTP